MQRSERNERVIENVHYKLVRDQERVLNFTNWIDDKKNLVDNFGDNLTYGTPENEEVLRKSFNVPKVALAIGVLSAAVGLYSVSLKAFGPGINEFETKFFNAASEAGFKILGISGISFGASVITLLVPASVAALSVSKGFMKKLSEKVDEKTIPILSDFEQVLSLIEDIKNQKADDKTLEFISTFLKRVDLNGNSMNFNIELLKRLAYYRQCLKSLELGNENITDKDVQEAFNLIIDLLDESKSKLGVSNDFKNNRFVNLLIDEYGYKEEDFHNVRGI